MSLLPLLIALSGVPSLLPAQAPEPLLVAVLRSDGIALPFARYAAGEWSRLPFDSVPRSEPALSKPWHRIGGGVAPVLEPGPVLYFDPSSSDTWYEAWGILTDFGPRSFSEWFPADRVGALTSRSVPAVPLALVDSASADWQSAATLVRSHFDEMEEDAISRAAAPEEDRPTSGHPRAREARAQASARVREVWATAGTFSGTRLFYVVAEKRYPVPRPDYDCDAVSLLHGWIVEREGRQTLEAPELILSSCTQMQDRIAAPFAVLTVDDRHFVVLEWHMYEGSERDVLEITPSELRSVLGPQF